MSTSFRQKDSISATTRAALKAIAPGLAAELGSGWSAEDVSNDGHTVTLRGPDGAELNVWEGWPHDGKVVVNANFKDRDKDGHQFWYLPYKTSRPSIQVNPARGAVAVANDIKRRLWPAYLPLLAACNEARVQHETRLDSTADVAAVLAISIGGTHRKCSDGYRYSVEAYRSDKLKGASVDIKVNGDEVTFDHLRVNAYVAKELLALLAAHHVNTEE